MGCRVSKKNIQTSFLRDEEFMTFVDCSTLFFLLCSSTQMFPLSSFPNDFLLEYFLVSFFDISPSTAFLMSPFSHVFVFSLTAYYPWQNLSRSIEIKSQRIQVKESMLSIYLRITGKEQAIPRTHIHSCPISLLNISRVQANRSFSQPVFLVLVLFYLQAAFCDCKERTKKLLFISKSNLLKSLKRIIKLNFYV